jgi:hypothetical protein
MSGGLVELLRDARERLATTAAGRVRLENPAYGSRPLEEIARNVRRILDSWIRFLERGDWSPMSQFIEDVIRFRLPMGFKMSDLVGGITSVEETITEYVEDEDVTGEICASAHYAALRAAFHKSRVELVDRFIERSQTNVASLLEESYRRTAELEGTLATTETRGRTAASALENEVIPGLEECCAEMDRGVESPALRAHVEKLLAAAREALERLHEHR